MSTLRCWPATARLRRPRRRSPPPRPRRGASCSVFGRKTWLHGRGHQSPRPRPRRKGRSRGRSSSSSSKWCRRRRRSASRSSSTTTRPITLPRLPGSRSSSFASPTTAAKPTSSTGSSQDVVADSILLRDPWPSDQGFRARRRVRRGGRAPAQGRGSAGGGDREGEDRREQDRERARRFPQVFRGDAQGRGASLIKLGVAVPASKVEWKKWTLFFVIRR